MKTRQDRTARLNLVCFDPVRVERIKLFFRRILTFKFVFSEQPLFEQNFDLFVIPSQQLFLLPEIPATISAGVPVLAYGNPEDLAAAFQLGCTDYLKEPWLPVELHCRVQRICQGRTELSWGRFVLTETHLASPTGREPLNYQEYRILRTLIENRGQTVPREVLFYAIWGNPGSPGKRAVDMHISSIRKKLRTLGPNSTDCLRSVRGIGYRLEG